MLTVPLPPRFRMSAPPLVQAVVQVNFPIVSRFESVEGVAPLHSALFDLFPYLNQQIVQQVSLMIGPAGPATPQSAQATVYELTDDVGWKLSVTVSSATLEVGAEYAGVGDFARRFGRVCAALHEACSVRRCDRVGMRYLDLVELTDDNNDWARWFRPELIGLANPAISADGLVASLTETRLQGDPGGILADLEGCVEGIIRHGVVPPGSIMKGMPPRSVQRRAFVLDMDTYLATPQQFDEQRLVKQFGVLHAEIAKVFHWAVTEDGRARFGYELIDAKDAS